MPLAHHPRVSLHVEVLEDRCLLAGPSRPNILLLLTEDQRAEFAGHTPPGCYQLVNLAQDPGEAEHVARLRAILSGRPQI